MITIRDVEAAAGRVDGRVHRTPVFSARSLASDLRCGVWLKAELMQRTGSFKIRGVLNRLLTLSPEARERGLISLSAGNHAAALALGAREVGTRATIVMPQRASRAKVAATEAYGGTVILTEDSLLDVCLALRDERQLTLVHPFDDEAIIAGQGTVGLELMDDLSSVHVVVVPVGGGGLISGVATAVKGRNPAIRVIGVEPEGADAMSRSLAAGAPVTLERIDTIADGLAAPFAGCHTFEHVRELVDTVVRIPDDAIVAGMRLLYARAKLAAEPSGAAGLGALIAGAIPDVEGAEVVCVVSGGNVEPDVLRAHL